MYETVQTPLEDLISLGWLDKEITEDIKNFSVQLIEGCLSKIDEIDNLIRNYSKNWKFERLSAIDKSILRLSIYSLKFLTDIPPVVTINEGIELGKIYGGENSGQFINGILDAIMNKEFREQNKNHEPH